MDGAGQLWVHKLGISRSVAKSNYPLESLLDKVEAHDLPNDEKHHPQP